MFRLATKSDLPQITALWQEAFGDSPEAVAYFFKSFPGCISYVAEEDGAVVSMVHALPQLLSPDTPAAYIYAVATGKTHRGRGLCRQLMAFAEAELKTRGFGCCVLTPGEQSLFDYYATLGYETAFFRRRAPFAGGNSITMTEYLQRRERVLAVPHMVYDRRVLAYASEVYGLQFYATETGVAAAGSRYTAEVLPEDAAGEKVPFAMIKWLEEPRELQDAYLGFALE